VVSRQSEPILNVLITDSLNRVPVSQLGVDVLVNPATSRRKSRTTKEDLARIWNIGLDTADSTIKATTQLVVRRALHPIQRRFRTEAAQVRYPHLGGRFGRFSSDTMFAKCRSSRGNTMAQIFVNNIDYVKLIPMRHKAEA
jgi:hypothetical protein